MIVLSEDYQFRRTFEQLDFYLGCSRNRSQTHVTHAHVLCVSNAVQVETPDKDQNTLKDSNLA